MGDIILTLTGFGVSFGNKPILDNINLTIPERGIVVLLGPSGTGKSTLLRTISGVNDSSPSLQVFGKAEYLGAPLGAKDFPALVAQKTTLMMSTIRENIVNEMPERNTLLISQQRDIVSRLLIDAGAPELATQLDKRVVELSLGTQRLLAIVRTVAANPRMLLVDEPTSGVSDLETDRIIDYLARESEKRAIIVALHNQVQAKKLQGHSALLAGGRLVEFALTQDFFSHPQCQLAKEFVRSGSCCAPSLDTPIEEIDENYQKPTPYIPTDIIEEPVKTDIAPTVNSVRVIKSHVFGPRNFLWLRKGELAGTPQPGLLTDLDIDLESLKRVGISVLVSLTTTAIPQEQLSHFGIKGISFPIEDMAAPSPNAAYRCCEDIQAMLNQGEAIAFHCKAGLGRTGTMLVAYLIYEGIPALEALEKARKIEPRWVQSQEQVEFLETFEAYASNIFMKREENNLNKPQAHKI